MPKWLPQHPMGTRQLPEYPWGKGIFVHFPQVKPQAPQWVYLSLHQLFGQHRLGQPCVTLPISKWVIGSRMSQKQGIGGDHCRSHTPYRPNPPLPCSVTPPPCLLSPQIALLLAGAVGALASHLRWDEVQLQLMLAQHDCLLLSRCCKCLEAHLHHLEVVRSSSKPSILCTLT